MTLLKALAVAGFGLVVLILASAQSASPAKAGSLKVYHFGHLWDGARLIDNAYVVIDGEKIAEMGKGDITRANAEDIDLRKYTAIPGMIDLHTHVTYYWDHAPGSTPLRGVPGAPRRTTDQLLAGSLENGMLTLGTGVTTVRDLNGQNGVDIMMRDLINKGERVGPRMFVAGRGISAGATPMTPEVLKTQTEQRIQAGSDWVKLYGSKGTYDSVDTTQTMTFEQMKAVVDAAHALHHPVAIHSYGASGVHDAVMAGADSVEHGIEIDDATFKEMIKRGTVWVPTIDHNRYYVDAKDDYKFPDDHIPPLQDYIQKNFESAKRAFKLGVKLGLGSDAVYSGFGQNTGELTWFVKAGMTPAQALATTTTTAAALLGHDKDLGRIAPGFYADMVAIEGEPLKNINDVIKGVRVVIKGGAIVVDKR